MRSRYGAVAAVTLALVLAGCGGSGVNNVVDAAKSKAGGVVSQVECTAITAAKTQLANVSTADPTTLETLSGAAGTVVSGLAALGDKVPASLQDELASAQQKLDDAIAKAKTDPGAKAELTAAADGFGQKLDALSADIGC